METTKKALAPFEVKATDEDARTFTGLASTWDLDLGGDVIHPGAFKRTLDHWNGSGKNLPLIDQHNYGSVRAVVGKMTDGKETDDGLEAEFKIIDGPDGDEILRRVKGGFIDGLSIGYEAVKVEYPDSEEEAQGVMRHLKEVKLHEVSVVIWPMNEGARIDTDSVKHMVRAFEGRDLTDEETEELKRLHEQIGALLQPDGLAPEDPKRQEIERRIRTLNLRRHATRL